MGIQMHGIFGGMQLGLPPLPSRQSAAASSATSQGHLTSTHGPATADKVTSGIFEIRHQHPRI
jgi:hypothetical protein